jgi:hypothetical protein
MSARPYASGRLHVGCLKDDAARTALSTLLSQVAPAEVLVPRGSRVSPAARTALARCACGPRVTALTVGEEFPLTGANADDMLAACGQWGGGSGGGDGGGGGGRLPEEVASAAPAARAAAAALASHLRRLRCAAPLAAAQVGPGRYCLSRHPASFQPS